MPHKNMTLRGENGHFLSVFSVITLHSLTRHKNDDDRLKSPMLQRDQELIDQFNREEQSRQQFQRRKLKRRVRFPKLESWHHALLDMLDEIRERRSPADCISSKWTKGRKMRS